uniref:VWFA domain-containing protein n=1 Tax=Leersia perrieri TaxID=77586 RepID=A0A0D9XUT7_9ORYZ
MSQAQTENVVRVAAYAKVDATGVGPVKHRPGIPVLVRVVAAQATSERVPIDLVTVLDVSCCNGLGPVNRIELLKRAMKLIIDKLGNNDHLAIVTVPVQPSTIAEKDDDLMRMDAEGRNKAASRMESLVVTGEKKLSTALKKAVKILDDRNETSKKKAGFILLISDGDDNSVFYEKIYEDMNTPRYSIHAYGFRDAHNARAMHHIAKISKGTYGILNDEHDGITEAFAGSIKNITSIVAVNTVVEISCNHTESTARLTAIDSGRFKQEIDNDQKIGSIIAGTLQAGATRSFIAYIDNVADDDLNEVSRLITVCVRCESVKHAEAAETGSTMERHNGEVVVVKKGDQLNLSRMVAAEIVRVEAIRIVGEIIDKYKDNDKALAAVADELCEKWCRLKESEFGIEADDGEVSLISGLTDEMVAMEESIRRFCTMSYMLSWHTRHSLQHQTSSSSWSSTMSVTEKGKTTLSGSIGAFGGFVAGGGGNGHHHAAAHGAAIAGGGSGHHHAAAHGTTMAGGGSHHHAAAHGAAMAFGGGGIGERKRKNSGQYYYERREMEMIEHRLAYWSRVKCELPPMHHDGDCPDHMTTIFRDASRESIDRAMFHDVFLAVVHASGRKSSKSGGSSGGGKCSCGL